MPRPVFAERELLTTFLGRCLRKPLSSPALTRPGLPQVDYRTTISMSSHDTTRSSYVRCLVAVRHSTSACKRLSKGAYSTWYLRALR
jgi:hypothetical protein